MMIKGEDTATIAARRLISIFETKIRRAKKDELDGVRRELNAANAGGLISDDEHTQLYQATYDRVKEIDAYASSKARERSLAAEAKRELAPKVLNGEVLGPAIAGDRGPAPKVANPAHTVRGPTRQEEIEFAKEFATLCEQLRTRVTSDRSLEPTYRLVWVIITHGINRKTYRNKGTIESFKSFTTIASEAGVSRSTVIRAVKAFEKRGDLTIVRKHMRNNRYQLHPRIAEQAPPIAALGATGGTQLGATGGTQTS